MDTGISYSPPEPLYAARRQKRQVARRIVRRRPMYGSRSAGIPPPLWRQIAIEEMRRYCINHSAPRVACSNLSGDWKWKLAKAPILMKNWKNWRGGAPVAFWNGARSALPASRRRRGRNMTPWRPAPQPCGQASPPFWLLIAV